MNKKQYSTLELIPKKEKIALKVDSTINISNNPLGSTPFLLENIVGTIEL